MFNRGVDKFSGLLELDLDPKQLLARQIKEKKEKQERKEREKQRQKDIKRKERDTKKRYPKSGRR
jgi:hypothetical protein